MTTKIFDSEVLPEIAVTDTTPIPAINGSGIWTKVTGLGIKTYLSSSFESLTNKSTSVTTDQSSNIKYPSVKSVYDWVTGAFAKYSGDADFYQYSIVRTVASGNLTVALKNYEGNDPTATKPVKIMIGGVVRTITSALSATDNAGDNTHNAGSAELATKEIDYFFYLGYDATYGIIPGFSRIPYASVMSDFSTSGTNEKYITTGVIAPGFIAGTSSFVNIGRFNAILSAGAGYTWSVPATSVIVNYPIFESNFKSSLANATGFVSSASTVNYKVTGSMVTCIFDIGGTSNATSFTFKLPFSPTIIGPDFPQGLTQDNGANKTSPGRCTTSGNTVTCYSDLASGAWTASGNKLIRGQFSFILQ